MSGLGRGLGSLLETTADSEGNMLPDTSLPVGSLAPSAIQPRREFESEALASLSASIKSQGVLQPLLVRPLGNNKYEIIAGERRWRASQLAGLVEVPVIIREFDDGKALEVAIVENVQRTDLNPIDEADGYLRLVNEFNYTHEEISRVTGKSRSHITNLMRLLSLPPKLRECTSKGLLSMGHARALLGVSEDKALQLRLANLVIKKGLSVRETEDLVRKHNSTKESKRKGGRFVDAATQELENRLADSLAMKVRLRQKEGIGKITINFENKNQMADILKRLGEVEVA